MKIQKIKGLFVAKKIKEYLTVESAKKAVVNTGHFIMENKMFCLQLGIMAATVLMMQDTSFATTHQVSDYNSSNTTTGTGNTSTNAKISAIEGPMNTMAAVMSGTVPKAICTIGAAVGAASWAMNIENQVTKTAMRVVGGSSVALGATTFINESTGFVIF